MKNFLTTLALVVALAAAGRAARAANFPSFMQDGKVGRFMFNLKIGPAATAKSAVDYGVYSPYGCGFYGCKPTMGAIVLDFGVSVDAAHNAYLLFPLQFQVHDVGSIVMVPVGFQYDIPIRQVPGLYITPRALIGYAAFVPNCTPCSTVNGGFIALEVGAKLIFAKRWNVGFEPFSLPIFFGQFDNGVNFSAVSYRVLFYGGANF
jgi:hypothetical protein